MEPIEDLLHPLFKELNSPYWMFEKTLNEENWETYDCMTNMQLNTRYKAYKKDSTIVTKDYDFVKMENA